ncbi:MAG: GDSL-type esterase/lipase family protein [Acidobacteriota bacterium]
MQCRLRTILIALGVVACLLSVVAPASAQPVRYIAFGDSLTFGFGEEGVDCQRNPTRAGFPSRVAELFDGQPWATVMINDGVCGLTTSQALSVVTPSLNRNAQVFILMLGTNDIVQRFSNESIVFNLRQVGQRAEAAGFEVILLGPPPMRREPSLRLALTDLNEMLAGVARREGWLYKDLDVALSDVPGLLNRIYVDPLHPSAEGYDLYAEEIFPLATAAAYEVQAGRKRFCRLFGPCKHGEGGCIDDGDCATGLSCVADAGADFGLAPTVDVCIDPGSPVECGLPPGHVNRCGNFTCIPCGPGEGDCDSDDECRGDLVCATGLGPDFGYGEVDVCVAPTYPFDLPAGDDGTGDDDGSGDDGGGDDDDGGGGDDGGGNDGNGDGGGGDTGCPVPIFSSQYCALCGPCSEGQGQCSAASQCAPGLTCETLVTLNGSVSVCLDIDLGPDSTTTQPTVPEPPLPPRPTGTNG